ncbi:MAG: hypothetical protein ACKVS9_11115 [Phycisphaerae bacterium]
MNHPHIMQRPDDSPPLATDPPVEGAPLRGGARTRTWIIAFAAMAALASVSVEFGVRAHELRLRIESCRKLRALGALMHEAASDGRAMPPDWIEQLAMRGDDRVIDPRSRQPFIAMRVAGPMSRPGTVSARLLSARAPLARSPYISLLFGREEGGAVLFIDGHVEWLPRDAYVKAVADAERAIGRSSISE